MSTILELPTFVFFIPPLCWMGLSFVMIVFYSPTLVLLLFFGFSSFLALSVGQQCGSGVPQEGPLVVCGIRRLPGVY